MGCQHVYNYKSSAGLVPVKQLGHRPSVGGDQKSVVPCIREKSVEMLSLHLDVLLFSHEHFHACPWGTATNACSYLVRAFFPKSDTASGA